MRIAEGRMTWRGAVSATFLALFAVLAMGMAAFMCSILLMIAEGRYHPGLLAMVSVFALSAVALGILAPVGVLRIWLGMSKGVEYLEIHDGSLVHRTVSCTRTEHLADIGEIGTHQDTVIICRKDRTQFTSLSPLVFGVFDGSLAETVKNAIDRARKDPDLLAQIPTPGDVPPRGTMSRIGLEISPNRAHTVLYLVTLAIVLPLVVNVWWNAPRHARLGQVTVIAPESAPAR